MEHGNSYFDEYLTQVAFWEKIDFLYEKQSNRENLSLAGEFFDWP